MNYKTGKEKLDRQVDGKRTEFDLKYSPVAVNIIAFDTEPDYDEVPYFDYVIEGNKLILGDAPQKRLYVEYLF